MNNSHIIATASIQKLAEMKEQKEKISDQFIRIENDLKWSSKTMRETLDKVKIMAQDLNDMIRILERNNKTLLSVQKINEEISGMLREMVSDNEWFPNFLRSISDNIHSLINKIFGTKIGVNYE